MRLASIAQIVHATVAGWQRFIPRIAPSTLPNARRVSPPTRGGAIVNTVTYHRGREEQLALTRALIDNARAGLLPNCVGDDAYMWTSVSDRLRAKAAERCSGCVVFDLCLQAAIARQEAWFVMGGIDWGSRRKAVSA
jgi:hypothetical protein